MAGARRGLLRRSFRLIDDGSWPRHAGKLPAHRRDRTDHMTNQFDRTALRPAQEFDIDRRAKDFPLAVHEEGQ